VQIDTLSNNLHPTEFSYKEFNENDKLKFGYDLMYFLSKVQVSLLYIYMRCANVFYEAQNIPYFTFISNVLKFK
jgi:hypothetical protein